MPLNYDLLKLTPPEATIKPMSAKEYLEGVQGIRDARRKRAIEDAMRSGLDAEGNLSTESIRRSLIDQGFGEDADRIVREMTMARLGDISNTADVGMKLKAGVEAGIINPDVAQRAMGTSQSVRQIPVQPQSDTSWMEGVPTAPVAQEVAPSTAGNISRTPDKIVVDYRGKDGPLAQRALDNQPSESSTGEGEDGAVRITGSSETMQPLYEYERTESKAQAVPEYSANLIDFAKSQNTQAIGEISTTKHGGLTYALPEGTDKNYILAAAKTLGYTATDSNTLDTQLTDRAMAQVAQPVMAPKGYDAKSLLEARAEYAQKMAEYPALVAQKKAELIKQLEAGQAARFGQGTTRDQEARAAEAHRYGLAGQKAKNIFARAVNPEEAAEVKKQRAAIGDIKNADISTFEGQYKAALAKAKADGPVNQDAILANLVAMGAIPSEAALALKQYMTPGGSFTSEGFTFAKRIISSLATPTKEQLAAQSRWKTDAIANINQYIEDNGGLPYVVDEKKNDQKPKSASDTLKEKGVGGKKPEASKPQRRKASSEDF